MGLFTKSPPTSDLIARLETLERKQKALELDWEEMFERFRRLLARLSKRASDDERRASEAISESVRVPAGKSVQRDGIVNPLARRLLHGPHDGGSE